MVRVLPSKRSSRRLVKLPVIPFRRKSLLAGLSAVGAILVVYARLFMGAAPFYGQATTLVAVLFLGGVQLITLGIIGEYLGRIYDEVKGRPMYVVNEAVGFDDE